LVVRRGTWCRLLTGRGDVKARKGVYLGTSVKHKGWKILDLETRKIVNSRDVYFHENKFPFADPKESRSARQVMIDNDHSIYLTANNHYEDEDGADYALPGDDEIQLPEPEHHAEVQHRQDNDSGSEPDDAVDPQQPRRSNRIQQRPVVNYSAGSNLKTKMRNLNGVASNVGYSSQREIPLSPALSDPPNSPASENPGDSDQALIAEAQPLLSENFKKLTRKQVMAGPYKRQFLDAERRELECL